MATYFLVQVNNSNGYPGMAEHHVYENGTWMNRTRDQAQGSVRSGDTLLVYCTADVPSYAMSLAFQIPVLETSPDNVTLHLGELLPFKSPLRRETIRELIDTNQLDESFRSCGAQSFNIRQLDSSVAARALELLQSESETEVVPAPASKPVEGGGSPLDRLIETKLEEWLVENWQTVDFGSKLNLYEEDGEVVGQQYHTGTVGIIDLLCEDEETGDLVVIELKRGRQSDAVAGQLARYLGWILKHLADGRRVRGIVLASEFDDKLRYAIAAIPNSTLLRYETRFDVFVDQ